MSETQLHVPFSMFEVKSWYLPEANICWPLEGSTGLPGWPRMTSGCIYKQKKWGRKLQLRKLRHPGSRQSPTWWETETKFHHFREKSDRKEEGRFTGGWTERSRGQKSVMDGGMRGRSIFTRSFSLINVRSSLRGGAEGGGVCCVWVWRSVHTAGETERRSVTHTHTYSTTQ